MKQLSVWMMAAVLGIVSGPAALADCKEDYQSSITDISNFATLNAGLGLFTTVGAIGIADPTFSIGPVLLTSTSSLSIYNYLTVGRALEHGLRLIQQAEVGDGTDLRAVLAELQLDSTGNFTHVTIEALATAIDQSNQKRIFCRPKPISGKDIISIVKGQVRELE